VETSEKNTHLVDSRHFLRILGVRRYAIITPYRYFATLIEAKQSKLFPVIKPTYELIGIK
jgi:hypothetical protein